MADTPQEGGWFAGRVAGADPLRLADAVLVSRLEAKAMFESPLLQKMIAESIHKVTLNILKARFGTVPRDVARHLREILDEEKLGKLSVLAAQCADLQAFRDAVLS
jgi:hypothetical protein